MPHPPATTRRVGVLLFVLALTGYLATAGGSLTTSDAVATFDLTRSIVDRHSIAMSGDVLGHDAERGRDGRYYSPFGIGQSIYGIPFYLAAQGVTRATGLRIGKSDSLAKAFVALGETVVTAAVVWEFFQLAVAWLGALEPAVFAALTLAFGTILWPYSGFGFNQPLACFTLLAATRRAFLGTRHGRLADVTWSSLWLAASLLTRHEMMIAALPLAAWLWLDGSPPVRTRVRRLAAFAPGLVTGAAVWLIYNAIRFGNPFDTGLLRDPTPGLGSSIVAGTWALVASPSASLFLYSPVALAGAFGLVRACRGRLRPGALLFGSLVLVFLALYGTLGNWIGGRSYGSRYMVVALPYLCLGWAALLDGLARLARIAAFVVMTMGGALLQLPGVLIDYAKVSQSVSAGQTPFTTEQRQWQWSASPLVLNTRALARALPENAAYLLGRRSPPAIAPAAGEGDRSFSQQFSFSLDVWWLYLFYLRALSAWAVAAILAAFAGALLAAGARLRVEMRDTGGA